MIIKLICSLKKKSDLCNRYKLHVLVIIQEFLSTLEQATIIIMHFFMMICPCKCAMQCHDFVTECNHGTLQ